MPEPHMTQEKQKNLRPKVFMALGVTLILLGILFNQWLVEELFVRYSSLSLTHKILIGVVDAVAVTLGILCIYFRTNKRMQVNIGLLIVSMGVGALLIEALLHIALPLGKLNAQQQGTLSIIQEDSNGGPYMVMPNLRLALKLGGQTVTVDTNSLGMRWPEVDPKPAPNKKRIVFVGDSQTFGLWASNTQKTFVGRFASALKNDTFEVMNFGVPGYSFLQMEHQLRTTLVPFSPSHVILVNYNANDFADTWAHDQYIIQDHELVFDEENFQKKISVGQELTFSLRETAKQNPLLSLLKNTLRALRNSYTYITVHNATQHVVGLFNDGKPVAFNVSDNFLSGTYWSQKDYPPPAKNAVAASLEKLEAMRVYCKEHGIKLMVVTLPFYDQVYAAAPEGKTYDIRFPQKYVQDYAAKHEVPYFDLLPSLREYVASHKGANLYFRDNGHLNDPGHEVVGGLIKDFFATYIQ